VGVVRLVLDVDPELDGAEVVADVRNGGWLNARERDLGLVSFVG